MDNTAIFQAERPRLISLCYRMLGERAAAEDAVQDTYLRWAQADHAVIADPAAWLTRVATRIAIDALRSARARRETYVGPWLPEPLVVTADQPVEQDYILAQDCNLALLWAMERLDATERAALILRDVFDADYSDLAETLDKSEAPCRQLVSRARRRVQDAGPRFEAPAAQVSDLIARFFAAAATQDFDRVKSLLSPQAVALSDGGAKVRAARRPLNGPMEIAPVMVAITSKYGTADGQRYVPCHSNGAPALLHLEGGKPQSVITLMPDANGQIGWIYMMRAPAKLRGITGQTALA